MKQPPLQHTVLENSLLAELTWMKNVLKLSLRDATAVGRGS